MNIIFQRTWEKVVSGDKTQTRRIVHPNDELFAEDYIDVYTFPMNATVARHDGKQIRTVYAVGQKYAVMPARGVKGLRKVADIEITRIRREDVREITESDAIAEGFYADIDFWHTWVDMHDKSFYEAFAYAADTDYLNEYGFFGRPDKYYDAWALDFRVIAVYADAIEIARELLRKVTS